MANRLVSVDDNLNLPPAVQEQLTGNVRNEFTTYLNAAENAADSAQADAVTAVTARNQAVAAAESVTIPTDQQVDAAIARATADDVVLSERSVLDLGVQNFINLSAVSGITGTKVTIPTPDSPTGGEVTHPSVVFVRKGWNGYRYWMAFTPYAGGNDDLEDPCIVASNDGITWVVPSGLTNPIDDATGQPDYNSDTDLRLGPDGALYLFWRYYNQNNAGAEETIYFSKSFNGVDWSARTVVMQNSQATRRLVSPSFLYRNGQWWCWAVDIMPSPNRIVLFKSIGETPDSGWSAPQNVNAGTMQTGKEPWHLYIDEVGGQFVGLLNDCTLDASGTNGDLLMITSRDGVTFANSGTTIIPRSGGTGGATHTALYRGCFVPAMQRGEYGFQVWYGGWVPGTPPVWHIFRTWVTDATVSERGEFTNAGSIPATNGFVSVPIAFTPGRFRTPPFVTVVTDSGRLNVAAAAITKDGFNFNMNNWTSAQITAGSARLYWEARG